MSRISIIEVIDALKPPKARTASVPFVLACSVMLWACATTSKPTAYNPEHLTAEQAATIGQVCHEVVGYKPGTALDDNSWPGDPDPANQTNGYHGCVATLSRSFLQGVAAKTEADANRACQAQGLTVGSPALAECVLKRIQTTPASASAQQVSLSVSPFDTTQGAQSSSSERTRREQQACVEVGLEPEGREFADCMSGLDDVMTAMRLGKYYRN